MHVLPLVLSLNMIGIPSGEYFCSCFRCIVPLELNATVCMGKEVSGEQRGAGPRLNRECKKLKAPSQAHHTQPRTHPPSRTPIPAPRHAYAMTTSTAAWSQPRRGSHHSTHHLPVDSMPPSNFSLLDTPVTNQIKYYLIRYRAITANIRKNKKLYQGANHGSTMCLRRRLLEGSPLQAWCRPNGFQTIEILRKT